MKDLNAREPTTNRKALSINLDEKVYGTFAEIGAGQEVARYFFQAGAAAGTIAKSISAYDMTFSDAIYGKSQRYVSRDRLVKMMEHEFKLLQERLAATRGDHTSFFAFANTVAAKSFKGGGESHGWLGIRYQAKPKAPPNDIVVHVRMLDKTNIAQQDALGIFGVNFIYSSLYETDDIEAFVRSLEDNIGRNRIEVDILQFHGPDFKHINNRKVSLELVKQGLTNAVLFGSHESILQPADFLYKKAIILERGSFKPITKIHLDMLECAGGQFVQEPHVGSEEVAVLFEITIHNLLESGASFEDLLERADVINALGYNVLVSNYAEYYRLSAYLRRYTRNMIGIVLGLNLLLEIFKESYYTDLEGGILEACGRLFKENMKLYVYPVNGQGYSHYLATEKTGKAMCEISEFSADKLVTAANLQVTPHLRNLYSYLLENHYIEPIVGFNPEYLNILSRQVLKMMAEGDKKWETMVPSKVVEIIKKKKLWGVSSKPKSKATAKTKKR